MEYRKLGRTGMKVSELCLGTMQFGWQVDPAGSFAIMDAFIEAGGNFLDTADIYSRWAEGNPGGVSEGIIGDWLKSRKNRSTVIVATKVRGQMGDLPNDQGLSRKHIIEGVDASLRRLGTDYIDLYQTHWYDEDTPIEETLRALDDLVRSGKVRAIGASNYPAWRLMESLWRADELGLMRYDTLQPYYNLVDRDDYERELQEVCRAYSIAVIPYSPLAAGFLSGKYSRDKTPDSPRAKSITRRYFNERGWKTLDVVRDIASERNTTTCAVALAWQLAQPEIVSPIIGATSTEQLAESLAVVSFRLSDEEKKQLDTVSSWREE